MIEKRYLTIAGILLIAWGGFSVAAYFVAHKPVLLQFLHPLTGTAWSLILTGMLTINSICLGGNALKWLIPEAKADSSQLLVAGGIGLGMMGLLGFGLVVIGWTSAPILLLVQLILIALFIWRGVAGTIFRELKILWAQISTSSRTVSAWMRWAAILALVPTFLRTLLPPIEAFDALLYHLTIPVLWIRDGGLQAYDFPHYWFPGIVESVYLWGIGLGSEIVPQQIHFVWAILTALLIWDWTRKVWGDIAGWWSLMLIISMPSLLLLASWAYTDLALTFFGVAMLYCLWHGLESQDTRWLNVAGIAAGMAMGVKYTSVYIPVSAVIMIFIQMFHKPQAYMRAITQFSLVGTLTGMTWYIRNWIWMGNPFYPFGFGGRYWDDFRAAAFSGAGTGSGWNWEALILLPITITLGNQDVNYFDGDIGPLFLVTLPIAIFVYARMRSRQPEQRTALGIIGIFIVFGTALWVFGYVTTRNLWQTRLLIPALIPFVIPAAIGIASIHKIDTSRFRVSFILSVLAALSIFTTLINASLSVISRNPLAVATGITSRDSYFEKYQPAYFTALLILTNTPADARILFLFEPRSYGSARDVQPDPILDRFSHDLNIHAEPGSILQAWRAEGYTHVMVNVRGASFMFEDREERQILDETLTLLELIEFSPEAEYALYRIPLR